MIAIAGCVFAFPLSVVPASAADNSDPQLRLDPSRPVIDITRDTKRQPIKRLQKQRRQTIKPVRNGQPSPAYNVSNRPSPSIIQETVSSKSGITTEDLPPLAGAEPDSTISDDPV
ncbi:MAG: hypothetical protein ACR2O4_15105, partial [Hyphomicrobiaceae bacterium]